MGKDIYYAAYGSNLNHQQMRLRCPAAQPIATTVLPDWQLVFRGVADIIPAINTAVPVGLYKITAACEAALDHHENYPVLYGKKSVDLYLDGHRISAMTYIMNPRYGYGAPSEDYIEVVRQGYQDWQIPYSRLIASLQMVLVDGGNSAYQSSTWSPHGAPDRATTEAIIQRLQQAVDCPLS